MDQIPDTFPSPKRLVVVIGAGVIGLECARALQARGYRVHVIAKHVPGDNSVEYTSPWAGAHWRPHSSAQDLEQRQWDMETYVTWLQLAQREAHDISRAERSGISIVPSLLLWDTSKHAELQPTGDASSLWFAREVEDFQICSPPEHTTNVATAARFTTLALDVPQYLSYLQGRISDDGGRVTKATLPTNEGLDAMLDAASQIFEATADTVFVNASGLAARHVVPDEKVYPIRGQVVVVKGVAPECRTRQGQSYISYVIPRPGSNISILGGSKGVNEWNGAEDTEITKAILERARTLVPELLNENGQFDVLGVQVGLRPAREGGARVEKEVRPDGRIVIHAYGHGGAGFQNSVGVAHKVERLADHHTSKL